LIDAIQGIGNFINSTWQAIGDLVDKVFGTKDTAPNPAPRLSPRYL
jgi:hypothetical protein